MVSRNGLKKLRSVIAVTDELQTNGRSNCYETRKPIKFQGVKRNFTDASLNERFRRLCILLIQTHLFVDMTEDDVDDILAAAAFCSSVEFMGGIDNVASAKRNCIQN